MSGASGPFQALIFDAGGVFVAHDNERLFRRLAARCVAADALERIRAQSGDPGLGRGETSIPALHRRLQEEMGYRGDWPTFAQDWCCHFAIDRDMLGLMTALASDHRVAIFSNTNHEHWTYVTAQAGGALGRFEQHLSHEIGQVKPDVEAFRLVADRAGVDPGRCLFFDDLAENIEGARRAGFQAEQFTSQGALEALLQARGVRWSRAKQEIFQ
jgi:FMN phosphatase YigB (HAD superfamily)